MADTFGTPLRADEGNERVARAATEARPGERGSAS
jgi:hypothetical protein